MNRRMFPVASSALALALAGPSVAAAEARRKVREGIHPVEAPEPHLSVMASGRAAAPDFPLDVFGPLADLVQDLARGRPVPVDCVAAALLTVAGGLLGKVPGLLARLALILHYPTWAADGARGREPTETGAASREAAVRLFQDCFMAMAARTLGRESKAERGPRAPPRQPPPLQGPARSAAALKRP